MSPLSERFRAWYGQRVVDDAAVQTVLLNAYKVGLRARARARGVVGLAGARPGVPTNVYYATVQKTGSHWFKAVFDDPRVRRLSGLWSYPGHRYEWDEFHKRFPRRHFVPALFISHGQYEEIVKPPDHRTFYVTRDPRDIVVSWYFSMRDTHRLVGKVPQHRAVLRERSFEDGITYALETLAYTFSFMRSWAYAAPRDPNVLVVKFEDVMADPRAGLRVLFDHCRIPVSDALLDDLASDYTKDKMRERDEARSLLTQRSTSSASHYRPEASSWQEAFTPEHRARFAAINGDLLDLLGYSDAPSRP